MADSHERGAPRAEREQAARRTLIGMIGTAAVVAVGLGSLAVAGGADPEPDPSRAPAVGTGLPDATRAPAPADPAPTTPTITVPAGMVPITGDGGGVVGYVRVEDERAALDGGEPAIVLGESAVAFRGLSVVDADGRPVGWFLSGDLGFVSNAEVADPEQLAAIEATWLAEHPEAAP